MGSRQLSAAEWFREWAEPCAKQKIWPLAIQYYTNAIQTAELQQPVHDLPLYYVQLSLYYVQRAKAYEAEENLLLALKDTESAKTIQSGQNEKNEKSDFKEDGDVRVGWLSVRLQRARILCKLGHNNESAEECRLILERWPTCVPALNLMVLAKHGLQDFEGSIPFIDRLMEIQADDYEHPWQKARTLKKIKPARKQDELLLIERAIELIGRFKVVTSTHPPSVGRTHQPPFVNKLRFERALILLDLNRSQEALEQLRQLELVQLPSEGFQRTMASAKKTFLPN